MRIPWTVFPHIGSKARLAGKIAPFLPVSGFTTYVEPFAGSASIYLRLMADGLMPPGCTIILNDADGDITNLFAVIRDRADELADAVALTPVAQAEFGAVDPSLPSVERARRFLARVYFSFNAGESHRKWCMSRTSGAERVKTWSKVPRRIRALVEPLSQAVITNVDAIACIKKFQGPGAFFVVDPPYLDKEAYYAAQFDAHHELATVLRDVEAAGVVVTHEVHADLRELYPAGRWDRVVIPQPPASIYRRSNAKWTHETIMIRGERRGIGHARPCEVCSRQFVMTRSDARYCSSACRQRAYRQRRGSAPA